MSLRHYLIVIVLLKSPWADFLLNTLGFNGIVVCLEFLSMLSIFVP
ncbi:MAG: hypothetical protein ACJAWC_002532 [Yoonia sp.]